MPALPDFCCPRCRAHVARHDDAYVCAACAARYPVVLGIPDFRLWPDPFIALEDDHKKGRFLAANAPDLSFEDLVRFYWSITPDVTDGRDERFTARVVNLYAKWRDDLPRLTADLGLPSLDGLRLLEVGCGTGGLLAAAAERGADVVGVDVAFRWLVVARRQFEARGLDVPLVCANAEALPFRDATFDVVVQESVVEHLRDQARALAETRRALRPTGGAYLVTANRWSLTPEPHVRVWGVGFLPRRWMDAYVRRRRGIPYEHHRLLSRPELTRLVRRHGFRRPRYLLPPIPPAERDRLSPGERRQVDLYHRLRRLPGARAVLRWLGPLHHVVLHPASVTPPRP